MQIRYAGKVQKIDHTIESYVCKGVLVVDPDNNKTCDTLVRESMLKANIRKECSSILGGKLGIIEWSRPSPGRLGQQLLCLLTGGIPGADLVALRTSEGSSKQLALPVVSCVASSPRHQTRSLARPLGPFAPPCEGATKRNSLCSDGWVETRAFADSRRVLQIHSWESDQVSPTERYQGADPACLLSDIFRCCVSGEAPQLLI